MPTTPNQNSLEQDLIDLLNRRRGIEEASLDDARDLANILQSQTKELKFQIIERNQLRSIGRDIVRISSDAFSIQNKEFGTTKGLTDLAKQRQALEKNIYLLIFGKRDCLKIDGFVKSRHPGESRGPEVLEKTGFRLSLE
jgi:hypothetical protein